MNILRILREQAKDYDCTVCGTNHSRSDIRVLGKIESAWIVRVTCGKCQTSIKLLVVVDEQRAAVSPVKEERARGLSPRAPRRPPVTSDEVIDAHEFLEGYHGDVRTLFARKDKVETERELS